MKVKIDRHAKMSLSEADDFGAFGIECALDDPMSSEAFANIASPAEDDRYWLSADAIVALSGNSEDAAWVDKFWAMISKAEKYGFSDMARRSVKAHVI